MNRVGTTLENKKMGMLVRRIVLETIQEILNDPDYGLELQNWVTKRLKKKNKKLIPAEEVRRFL